MMRKRHDSDWRTLSSTPRRFGIHLWPWGLRGSGLQALDLYGHLFGDRLDTVADAMAAGSNALADVYRMGIATVEDPLEISV